VNKWQSDIGGAGLPTGCSNILSCGMWIGFYQDKNHNPVAGVLPARPGDPPNPNNILCFRGDRGTLSNEDLTDGTGMCALGPDNVESHGGTCAATGCMCAGMACSPTWQAATGGTAPGVVFIQPFTATM